MTDPDAKRLLVANWFTKADQAIATARREHAAGDQLAAINRLYYACFYALSAALVVKGLQFSSHGAARAALHQRLVKPGELAVDLGKFYDRLFISRHEADYAPLASFTAQDIQGRLGQADSFIAALKTIAYGSGPAPPTEAANT